MSEISNRIIIGSSGVDLADTLSIVNNKIEEHIKALFQPEGAPVINVTKVNDQAVYGIFQVMVGPATPESAPIIRHTHGHAHLPSPDATPVAPAVPAAPVAPATFDPLIAGNGAILKGDDLILTAAHRASSGAALATGGKSSGKWYADFLIDDVAELIEFGVINSSGKADLNHGEALGATVNSWGYFGKPKPGRYILGSLKPFGVICAKGDHIGVAMDLDNGFIYISKNDEWMNGADPAKGTATGALNPERLAANTDYYIAAMVWDGGQITKNLPAHYTAPKGYTAM